MEVRVVGRVHFWSRFVVVSALSRVCVFVCTCVFVQECELACGHKAGCVCAPLGAEMYTLDNRRLDADSIGAALLIVPQIQ